jgi:Helix-hairpin-helix motif
MFCRAAINSASPDEVEDETQGSLKININTAGVDELAELPEVGPATGETIIEYRRTDGMFRCVAELTSMRNRKTPEIGFHAVLSGVGKGYRFNTISESVAERRQSAGLSVKAKILGHERTWV